MLLVLGLTLLGTSSLQAFESRDGDTVVIEADEVVDDDLYVTARILELDGTVNGDLIFLGQQATVRGTVTGDLIGAGQNFVIEGNVSDDIRLAAYAMVINGAIGDDVVATGFSLETKADAEIAGDVLFAGYQASLDGAVEEDLQIAGGAVNIKGHVRGDAKVDVGGSEGDGAGGLPPGFPFFPGLPPVPSVPPGLTIGEQATIEGTLGYTANDKVSVPSETVEGNIEFSQYVPKKPEKRPPISPLVVIGRWFVRQLRQLITLLLVGALLIWLLPDWMRRLSDILQAQPLPSFGWGFVALAAFCGALVALVLVTALVSLILGAVTLGGLAKQLAALGGILTGTAGLSFSITWAYLTRIAVSVLVGRLIFQQLEASLADHRWWPMVLGVSIFVGITAIPVLGWFIKVAVTIFGLGAIWLWGRAWLSAYRGQTPVAEAA
jgi:cytoskeletal protein CcmA (bactofilin family)